MIIMFGWRQDIEIYAAVILPQAEQVGQAHLAETGIRAMLAGVRREHLELGQ
jgi:hypothetical protein